MSSSNIPLNMRIITVETNTYDYNFMISCKYGLRFSSVVWTKHHISMSMNSVWVWHKISNVVAGNRAVAAATMAVKPGLKTHQQRWKIISHQREGMFSILPEQKICTSSAGSHFRRCSGDHPASFTGSRPFLLLVLWPHLSFSLFLMLLAVVGNQAKQNSDRWSFAWS